MTDVSLRILIAEDSAPDRLILESIVMQAGHIAITVADGAQAIEAFTSERPDIILLDVLMPIMGGLEAAVEIRKLSQDELVPILFLTSLTDSSSLVQCIEAGGDDFIPKPYNRTVLQSKIKAFARMRDMHQKMSEQKKQIEDNHRHLIQEQAIAKQVFDKITHSGCLDDGYVKYYMSPLAVFNGDVIVAEVSPTGSLIVMLGDFTGHGLPAAIGSMPLTATFYGMVRKGFSISEIMREINQKLHEILPVGFFCCATCLDINFQRRRLRVWNGGLPELFLYRKQLDDYELLGSRNLPLGVLSSKTFNAETQRVQLNLEDRIYMWSDGVFEARDSTGDMFGEPRLHALMNKFKGQDSLFDQVLGHIHNHIGLSEKDDDISLIEILVDEIQPKIKHELPVSDNQRRLADWSMEFTLPANSLKQFDPLPLLTSIINEVPGLRPHRTALYTVLAELYSNALEHGVLELDSKLKSNVEGFAQYYTERTHRLDNLKHGFVSFTIKHQAYIDSQTPGGLLNVRIRDSGKGFDAIGRVVKPEDGNAPNYFGRGLSLMASMCKELVVHPPGNDIEVSFEWFEGDEA